jgi:hypothetical protein
LDALETIQLVVTGPWELVHDRLQEYIDAGARHIVCRLGTLNLATQAEQLAYIAQILV